MSATPQVNAYLRFMKWFSENHPELHRKYWQYFTAPKSGNNEVVVEGTDLDAGTFANLVQLQCHGACHLCVKKRGQKRKKGQKSDTRA